MFRNDEVNILKGELESGNNILIYGEGGYGKTSLAMLLFELVKDDYKRIQADGTGITQSGYPCSA